MAGFQGFWTFFLVRTKSRPEEQGASGWDEGEGREEWVVAQKFKLAV